MKKLGLIQKAAHWLQGGARPKATPAYNSTGTGRATSDWVPSNDAINALISGGGDVLRRQSRDVERRNAWASNAVESYVSNAIGTGIDPLPKHPQKEVNQQIKEAWLRWTDEADAAGLTDFAGLQSLACRTTLIAGECLGRLRPRRAEDGLTVPLQVQLLEPEHLPLTMNQQVSEGRVIRWGIEFDPLGRRVAYHLYREHPGEQPMFAPSLTMSRVPAEEVMHLYRPLRPGQHRGQPWLAAVLLALHEVEKYDRATLVKQAIAAMFAVCERDIDGTVSAAMGQGGEEDASGVPLQGIEPGSYIRLPMGKTIECTDPPDIGTMYPDFMRVQLRKIAAGIGITYEMLTGDLTGVNYSSIRAGLLEFRRRCEAFQHQVMVYQFCRPVWKAWIKAAAMVGVIDAGDYLRNPQFYLDVEWTPPPWPWVDPLKDQEAEILAINNLLKSRTKTIKESGYDREDVDAQIAEEQAAEETLRLKRNDAKAAAAPPQFPTDAPPQKGQAA